jgi:hypothetical protein
MQSHGIGDDHPEYRATLAAIGEALGEFSKVEIGVQMIFTELAWMQSDHDAYLIMASIPSFDLRVRLTSNFIRERKLAAPLQQRWDGLAKRAQKLNLKRAELAHFAVVIEADMIGDPITGISIQPYFSLSSRDRGRPRLKRAQIEDRKERFTELSRDLMAFMKPIRPELVEARVRLIEQHIARHEKIRPSSMNPDQPDAQ